MLKLLPGVFVLVVCILSSLYGKWRRDRGSPVNAWEMVWMLLLVIAISFPAMALPSILGSEAMTPRDRIEAFLASAALGVLPLAVGLCLWGALKLVRVYIDRARSAPENVSR
jgi:RsiW-degrading membrane proteinase PrsW (M82 family)